jgi:hypothetical protein
MTETFEDITSTEGFVWPTISTEPFIDQPLTALGGQSIHQIIQTSTPPETQTQLLSETCDTIAETVTKRLDIISRTVKTGSMSRGTHLSGSHDVDMTILVKCDENEFLEALEPFAPSRPLPDIIVNTRNAVASIIQDMFGDDVVNLACDAHIVKATIHQTIFDITIVPDISPYTALDTITGKSIRSTDVTYRMLTGVLCKLPMNSYKQAPNDVKDMLRVIKYWFGLHKWGKWRPRSFPIETFLLDIFISRQHWTHRELFVTFLEDLIKCRTGERKPAKVFGTPLSAFIFIGRPKNFEENVNKTLKELL